MAGIEITTIKNAASELGVEVVVLKAFFIENKIPMVDSSMFLFDRSHFTTTVVQLLNKKEDEINYGSL